MGAPVFGCSDVRVLRSLILGCSGLWVQRCLGAPVFGWSDPWVLRSLGAAMFGCSGLWVLRNPTKSFAFPKPPRGDTEVSGRENRPRHSRRYALPAHRALGAQPRRSPSYGRAKFRSYVKSAFSASPATADGRTRKPPKVPFYLRFSQRRGRAAGSRPTIPAQAMSGTPCSLRERRRFMRQLVGGCRRRRKGRFYIGPNFCATVARRPPRLDAGGSVGR